MAKGKSATEIVKDILAHVAKEGSSYSNWYAGITANIKRRLHEEHNVPKEGHWFIHRSAISETDARAAEETLLDKGFDGGEGGGENPTIVYAYKKTSRTDP